jgi:hypothetical protein
MEMRSWLYELNWEIVAHGMAASMRSGFVLLMFGLFGQTRLLSLITSLLWGTCTQLHNYGARFKFNCRAMVIRLLQDSIQGD